MSEIFVYHGSNISVEKPDIWHSRVDIDFGVGFYTTRDKNMASKWACNKNRSILNTYYLNISKLKSLTLKPDEKWLDYICFRQLTLLKR